MSIAERIERAATIFSLELVEPTVLRQGRATVVRATVTVVRASSSSGLAAGTLIIKLFQPDHRQQFLRERAGLGLLSSLRDLEGFVPQLLDDDEETLTLLIEDVPEQASYADLLIANDWPAAIGALNDTARRLGLLHGHARVLAPDFNVKVQEQSTPGSIMSFFYKTSNSL